MPTMKAKLILCQNDVMNMDIHLLMMMFIYYAMPGSDQTRLLFTPTNGKRWLRPPGPSIRDIECGRRMEEEAALGRNGEGCERREQSCWSVRRV